MIRHMSDRIEAKIIALDLDDTLLKTDLTISDYTVGIVQKAVQRGIYVTLCSGRTDNAILPYVRRLEIAGTQGGRYIIAQNGASIIDLHERKVIYSRFVDSDVLVRAFRIANNNGFACQVYDPSTIYIPFKNKWADTDLKLSRLKEQVVPNFEEFLTEKQHAKMVISGEPADIARLESALRTELGGTCVLFTSKPFFLEILPKDTGKGEALLWLAERLGIPQKNTMAFGDAMNDESMIRLAGCSVAMKNGSEAIKKLAAYTSEFTNDEDGVARFIEKHVL